MALRTLTEQLVAELVKVRLLRQDGSVDPMYDETRVIFAIPEALKRLSRKVAADPNLRNLMLTDPTVAVLPITNGLVNLLTGQTNYRFLIEFLDFGQMYHQSFPVPLQRMNPTQGRLASSYFASSSNFGYYYMESSNLVPSVGTLPANLSIPSANVNASTDVFTATGHGLTTGQGVSFAAGSTLPGGLTVNTVYFVIAVDANTFKLATSYANAIAGTAIDVTTVGTGTHTLNPNTIKFAVPTYPGNLADLPLSEEIQDLFIDKVVELLPESSGGDYAQDGPK